MCEVAGATSLRSRAMQLCGASHDVSDIRPLTFNRFAVAIAL